MPSCFLGSTPLLHFEMKVPINAQTGQVASAQYYEHHRVVTSGESGVRHADFRH
jgi:hypothetical protein